MIKIMMISNNYFKMYRYPSKDSETIRKLIFQLRKKNLSFLGEILEDETIHELKQKI